MKTEELSLIKNMVVTLSLFKICKYIFFSALYTRMDIESAEMIIIRYFQVCFVMLYVFKIVYH